MGGTNDASLLQLVHQATGTVVADSKLTLNETRRTALLTDDETGGILEHRVEMLHVYITALATIAVVGVWLWQFEGREISLLVGDELVNLLYLGGVDKGTLYTDRFATIEIEHITTTYQLLGTWAVEDGT